MNVASKPSEVKRACNFSHARTRANERYGLELTNAELERIVASIQFGGDDYRPLRPDGNHKARTWVAVKLDGRWIPVVYDQATQSVVTCLPERVLDPYRATLGPEATPDPAAKAMPLSPRPLSVRGNLPGTPMPTWPEPPGDAKEILARRKILREWIDAQCAILSDNRWTAETARRFACMEVWRGWRVSKIAEVEHARKQAIEFREMMARFLETDGFDIGDGTDPVMLLRAASAAIEKMRGMLGCRITKDCGRVEFAIREYLLRADEGRRDG